MTFDAFLVTCDNHPPTLWRYRYKAREFFLEQANIGDREEAIETAEEDGYEVSLGEKDDDWYIDGFGSIEKLAIQ